MKNHDSMKRIMAMAKALARLQAQQAEEREEELPEEYEDDDDDMDLAADMLMEISDLLSRAAELSAHAAAILSGEDIEAECCPCYCLMEVCFDDEL